MEVEVQAGSREGNGERGDGIGRMGTGENFVHNTATTRRTGETDWIRSVRGRAAVPTMGEYRRQRPSCKVRCNAHAKQMPSSADRKTIGLRYVEGERNLERKRV